MKSGVSRENREGWQVCLPEREDVCISLTPFGEEGLFPVFHGGEVVNNHAVKFSKSLWVLHNIRVNGYFWLATF